MVQAPPRQSPHRARNLKWAGLILLSTLVAFRLYTEVVPLGASPIPWLIARVDGPTLRSPTVTVIAISYNDAGAMHSGDHWCWIVRRHWLLGRRVIASGYVGPDVAIDGQWAWPWLNGRTLEGPPDASLQTPSRWQPRLPRVIDIGG